jgi:hypothetical protein
MGGRYGRSLARVLSLCWIELALSGTTLWAAADIPYKGMSYAGWWSGTYDSLASDLSLSHVAETGANWISLVVTAYQDNFRSTNIFRNEATPTDTELVRALDRAHALGLKVMLKPHLDLWDDAAHWRGEIGDGFGSESEWRSWFSSYREFIGHFADLAEAHGADMFCVGTELEGTTRRAADWRTVLAGVRARYHGPVVYAANHSGEETGLTWWDALDLIGVDAYYALATAPHPTVEELKASWVGHRDTLSQLAARWGKHVILTEIGYRSISGTASHPWDWQVSGEVSVQEQADAYQAALETFVGQSWFDGFFWWSWGTDPYEGGPCDTGYSPHDKPAEGLLREYYGAAHPWYPERPLVPDDSRTLDIYRDAPGAGWEDASWGAELEFCSLEHVVHGSCAIAVRLDPWGALSFAHPAFIPEPYLRLLEFWVYVPANHPPQLWAWFYDQDGRELVRRPVDDCRYLDRGSIVADAWNRVDIPLSHLGTPGFGLTRLCLEDRSGQGSSTFWVDDIRLVASERTREEKGERRGPPKIDDIRRH